MAAAVARTRNGTVKVLLLVLFIAVLVVALVAWLAWRRSKSQAALWTEACANPLWEVEEMTFGGKTYVALSLVARHRKQRESFGGPDRIGVADIKEPDWQTQLAVLRIEAEGRAAVLNEARNRSAKELD